MSEGLLYALLIVPILAVLILIHEIGHFVSARAVGVKVEEFGIGIPPRIKGWRRKGVIWSINAIPFGGFVRVLGEDGKSMEPGSMNAKRPLQRAFFFAAGSGMNFLLAIVLMILVIGVQGIESSNVYIEAVNPGSPAAKAGWKAGDQVIEVAGAPVEGTEEVGRRAREFAGRPMSVVIERRGKLIETTVTPRANPPAGEGPTGVAVSAAIEADVYAESVLPGSAAATAGLQAGDRFVTINGREVADGFVVANELRRFAGFPIPVVVERDGETQELRIDVPKPLPNQDILTAVGFGTRQDPRFERVPASQVIPRGLSESWQQTRQIVIGVRELITGLVTGDAGIDQVAGPIGMGQAVSELVQISPLPLWVTVAQITIFISLNLALLNLLPLPALDGGRLLFVAVEILRGGRRIAPEREGIVHFAGLVLLLGLMFVVAFFDADRLIDGRSFLP